MSSAPRGLAPREGLELELMKMGRAGPPLEPRRRPQAGKSGDPHSQNTDTIANNLSRLENVLDDPLPIDDSFPDEQLMS